MHNMPRPALSTDAERLKPIAWFPPMWALGCGVVACGAAVADRWSLVIVGVLLAWAYSALGSNFFVIGMLGSALALRAAANAA
jgi:hypothetical protein